MSAILISILLLTSLGQASFACDDKQTNTYVSQILFGDGALSKSSDEKVKMLQDALYLCSEQSDKQGQDRLDFLKSKKVLGVPKLSEINVKSADLIECTHTSWEAPSENSKKNKDQRKKLLQNTVNKVFDFGFFNNVFGSNKGKCNSFAAMLYYSHILADYIADDPEATVANVNGKLTPPYSGEPSVVINGDRPTFTTDGIEYEVPFITYSLSLDKYGRAGVAYGYIGPDILKDSSSKLDYAHIHPSGWNNNTYRDVNGPQTIYNRSHIIGHQLGGEEKPYNLITGTDYLNKFGMKPLEDQICNYIKLTGNHVLYRVTPLYKGENLVCSGVQMEAYSVEDEGKGICFNRYCYNTQPGFEINYSNGYNSFAGAFVDADKKLPFAKQNANDSNPDLIFEMNKHLSVLFDDQKKSGIYVSMQNEIEDIANSARSEEGKVNSSSKYIEMNRLLYKYFEVLKRYVPKLLKNEEFFKSTFK